MREKSGSGQFCESLYPSEHLAEHGLREFERCTLRKRSPQHRLSEVQGFNNLCLSTPGSNRDSALRNGPKGLVRVPGWRDVEKRSKDFSNSPFSR